MQKTESRQTVLEVDGPLFHLATLSTGVPDAPNGIWIENEFVARSPKLREHEEDGAVYRFIAIDPMLGVAENAPLRHLTAITKRAMPGSKAYGSSCPIDLYAECMVSADRVLDLIAQSLADDSDPPELTEFVCNLIRTGFRLSCDLLSTLRTEFKQYWLMPPIGPFLWDYALYFHQQDAKWFRFDPPENFRDELYSAAARSQLAAQNQHGILPLLHVVNGDDLASLQSNSSAASPTFAEEMIATSLVDLGQPRFRSAILHAFIAFESATRTGLRHLLESQLKGLEGASVLDAVSRQLNTTARGQLVAFHLSPSSSLNWEVISALYDVRNQIVHRGRRRMPPYEEVREGLIEIYGFVNVIQQCTMTRP